MCKGFLSRVKHKENIDIKKLLKKWQRRLGLSDWMISVQFKDCIDMNQAQGRTKIQNCDQHAYIRLLQIEDRQKSDEADNDPELDLVHELIHVRLWAIDPDVGEGTLHVCREQAIDWIAKALITSDREGNN